jgi:hypothetical protein
MLGSTTFLIYPQPRRPKIAAISWMCCGIALTPAMTPNTMLHAMLVKSSMMLAVAKPKIGTIKMTAKGKNPRIGTDWRISRKGMMISPALLFIAAKIPTVSPNPRQRRYVMIRREIELSA